MAAAVLDSRVVTQPGAAHIPFAAVDFSSSFRSWWRSNNLHADLHHHQENEATHTITDAPDGFNDLPDARASRDASLSSFPLPAFDKPRAWLIPMLVLDATVSTAVLSPKSSSDGAPQATVMNHRSSYHHILRPCIARPPTPTQPPPTLPPPSPTSPQAVTFAVPPPEADDTAADTRDMVLPTASTSLLPNAAIPYPHLEELLDDLGDWPLSATIVSQAPPQAPAAIDSSFSIVPAAVTASELLGLQIDQGQVSVAPVGVWTDHWQSIERQIVRLERKLVLSKLDRYRLLLQPQPPPSTTPPSPYVASFSAQALPDCTVASASPEPLLQQVLALRPEHVEMVVDFVSMAVALVYMPLYSSGFLFAGRWFPLYFNGHTGKAASVALPRPSSTPILDSIASLLSSQTPRFFNEVDLLSGSELNQQEKTNRYSIRDVYLTFPKSKQRSLFARATPVGYIQLHHRGATAPLTLQPFLRASNRVPAKEILLQPGESICLPYEGHWCLCVRPREQASDLGVEMYSIENGDKLVATNTATIMPTLRAT